MASSLIVTLTVTTPGTEIRPAPVTDGEQQGLLRALTEIPDPLDPRGVRHPLSAPFERRGMRGTGWRVVVRSCHRLAV
jgi:hypothetical protein